MILKEKIVVITGGSRGIGRELAFLCENRGAVVIAPAREVLDIRNETAVRNFAKEIIEKYKNIDIWINNAGVFFNTPINDDLLDIDKARQIIDINFFGTVFGTRSALSVMKGSQGIIVTILSTAALDATRAKDA